MPFEAKLASLPTEGTTPNYRINAFVEGLVATLQQRVKPALPPEEWEKLMSDMECARVNHLTGTDPYPGMEQW